MKTKNLLFLLIIAAIICIGLNYFVFSLIKNANERALAKEEEALAFEKTSAELFPEDGGVLDDISRLNSFIVEKDGVVPFIEKFESDARSLGSEIKISAVTIDPEDDNAKGDFENLRIKFEAMGSWSSLAHLIFYIEHVPHEVRLEEASLSRFFEEGTAGSSVGKGSWKLRGELSVLKRK